MSGRFAFLEEIWGKGAANYLIEDSMKLRFAIAASIINSSEIPDKRILDVGCGITYVPDYLCSFERYHGIDVAPFVIGKNREHLKGPNISFSVDDLEGFQRYNDYNSILFLGLALFSQRASRPDLRLREVLVSKVSPHQHKLIILEVRAGEDYKVGLEDLYWLKGALMKKGFHLAHDFTFNIIPDKGYNNRRFIVLRG
jgi:hypothetical protein